MTLTGAAGAEHDPREILDVDLMHDPGVGRHGAVAVQRVLTPFEETVALAVAFELELRVLIEGRRGTEFVDLHGVIDDDLDRLQRVDLRGLAALIDDRVAHRRQIDDARDAREVLQQHAGRPEGDLFIFGRAGLPAGERRDVGGGDGRAVLVPQQVLEQHLQREGQGREVETFRGQGIEPEVGVIAAPDFECVLSAE